MEKITKIEVNKNIFKKLITCANEIKIGRRIKSFLAAIPFILMPIKGTGEIISYGDETTLEGGQIVTVYYATDNYALVNLGNRVNYVPLDTINLCLLHTNNDFEEVRGTFRVAPGTFMFLTPSFDMDKMITEVREDAKIEAFAVNDDGWYSVKYNGKMGFIHGDYLVNAMESARVIKVTGNNVNVRSGPSLKDDIIGFSDITDYFEVIEKCGDWYKVKYLNGFGYINASYASIVDIPKESIRYQKIVYLTGDTNFYDINTGNILTVLPKYQNAFVISHEGTYYKVMVDGVVGYIPITATKELSNRCVIIDLARQTLRIFENNSEIARFHIISGSKENKTRLGCFSIGCRMKNYQLTKENFVKYWMRFDGNIGIHDASWQKDKYYVNNAGAAYQNFGRGAAVIYPKNHGSHGCINMREEDATIVFNTVRKGDSVLVIGPNNLVRLHLISKIIEECLRDYRLNREPINFDTVKIKKLV